MHLDILEAYGKDEPEKDEMKEEQANEKQYGSEPYLFNDVNICKILSGIHTDDVSDIVFKSYDDSFNITSDDEFPEIDHEFDDDSLIATVSTGVSQELYVISNNNHDDDGTVEYYGYDKVVKFSDHDYERKPSVVASEDSHVTSSVGKRGRNLDEKNASNDITNHLVYKKVRHI